jgi:hypothetical protein
MTIELLGLIFNIVVHIGIFVHRLVDEAAQT